MANDTEPEFTNIQLILTMVLGMTVHGILNSYCFLDGQLQNNNVRLWQDFWIDAFIPGTWQVIYFVPVMAMAVPAILIEVILKLVNSNGASIVPARLPGYIVGMAVAIVVGVFSIKIILKHILRKKYYGFAIYSAVIGATIIVYSIITK